MMLMQVQLHVMTLSEYKLVLEYAEKKTASPAMRWHPAQDLGIPPLLKE